MAREFEWSCPHEWFSDRLELTLEAKDLRALAETMAAKLDHDEIQELFALETGQDGYFDPVEVETHG